MDSTGCKHLHDEAFDSLSQQGQMIKKREQIKMQPHFSVGTIVQVSFTMLT